jgi:glycosyltransferase involved in cell wall biosynthesis
MLIDSKAVKSILDAFGINIKGILHVGAHECEELPIYTRVWGVNDTDILWIDANEDLTKRMSGRGVQNCYTAVLDEREKDAVFKITNNGQSSSLLELGTHAKSYPQIVVIEERKVRTETLLHLFDRIQKDPKKYNVWNFDIQGSEFNVFKGSPYLLQYVDAIYTEINTADVYKGCGQLDKLDELLGSYGLQRVMTHLTTESWGDALYVRVGNPPNPFGTMSLAITTYRRFKPFLEVYLPKYLDLPHIESIVIADETGEDIDQILAQPWGSNPKLKFIRNPERLGAYHNKLNLMRNCSTDWIALIDSDNEVVPEYFEALYKYWLEKGADTTAVYIPGGIESREINSNTTTSQITHLAGYQVNRSNWNQFRTLQNSGYCLNLGNCVFHKSQIEFIPDNLPKDAMLECQLTNKILVENGFTLHIVPNMKYFHVVHPGSLYLQTVSKQEEFNRSMDWSITP